MSIVQITPAQYATISGMTMTISVIDTLVINVVMKRKDINPFAENAWKI